jgi:hypothetical protein
MTVDDFTPEYSPWRHGGWYVDNVRYPSGAVGCVSRNFPDHKWRIACDPRPGSFAGGPNDHTYPSREAAARAERDLIEQLQSRLYLLTVQGGIHPTVHGPYPYEDERERAAEHLRSIDDPEADAVFYATVDSAGHLEVS